MISRLLIRQTDWNKMVQHVDFHAPLEACGLLGGTKDRVQDVILVRNQAQSPVRFVMDPHEQLEAFKRIELQGLDLVGIFHSHPAGPGAASSTDIAEAAYPVVHVIWSRLQGEWSARGFWLAGEQALEVPLVIAR